MPRYLFHFRKNGRAGEAFDANLNSFREARLQAVRMLGEAMRDDPQELWADREWYVDVTDDCGLTLFTIACAAFQTAATGPGQTDPR